MEPFDALFAGLTEAYRIRIWPKMSEQWDVLRTEAECSILLNPDLTYMARPDALMRRCSDGTIWYWEDKTTSQNPENFCKGWDKMVQLHASAIVAEQQFGLEIAGCFVQGWYKGYQKAGTIYSPLAYAWCKPGLAPVKDQWSFEYRPGWSRRPITEVQGGVGAWVKSLPQVLIEQQFPVAGPIPIRRDLAAAYFRQVEQREADILRAYQQFPDRTKAFPQHFANCDEYGKFRRPCAFRECCWAPTVGRDPIGSGLFIARQPHHEAELLHVKGLNAPK